MEDKANSVHAMSRARCVDAVIAARGGVLAAGFDKSDSYPLFAAHAKGAYIWDVDGRRYLDFMLGFGSALLGHAHEEVTASVSNAISKGISPTLHVVEQIELAEQLCRLIPNAEQVAFLRTGSDATSLAVRLIRSRTERYELARYGYQGWHEWCAPRAAGIDESVRRLGHTLPYNDFERTSRLFETRGKQLAGVIMMPYEIEMPKPGYLEHVRQLCDSVGAYLIFDEVRSGLRLSLGGAQEYFGIRADLVCMSKAIANGHPLSAVTGPKELMSEIRAVSASSLYFRSTDGISAALATIGVIERENAIGTIWEVGKTLMDGLTAEAKAVGLPAQAVGLPPTPYLEFKVGSEASNKEALECFCVSMMKQGVLTMPGHHWFVSSAMGSAETDFFLESAARAFRFTASQL